MPDYRRLTEACDAYNQALRAQVDVARLIVAERDAEAYQRAALIRAEHGLADPT